SCLSDWSSDVCSSDLIGHTPFARKEALPRGNKLGLEKPYRVGLRRRLFHNDLPFLRHLSARAAELFSKAKSTPERVEFVCHLLIDRKSVVDGKVCIVG